MNIVNLLGTLDNFLGTRMPLLETAAERQVADVRQCLNQSLSSMESRVRQTEHHGLPPRLSTFDGQSSW